MTTSRAPLPQSKGASASGQQKAVAEAQRIAAKLTAAVALHQQGRLAQARLLYTEILQAQPRHFDALQLLATIAVQQKNPSEALVLFEHALKINPDNAIVLSNQASALLNLGRYEDALQSCDRALKSRPDYAEALSNRGNALWAMNRAAEALLSYDRALEIKPDYPEALSSRGAALRTLGRPLEALQSYDRALQLRPTYADALNNQGAALQDLQHPAEALASYARAQLVQPVYADAHMNEALCRLMLGEFELGWQKYEWRWKKEPGLSMARNFAQPLWLGKEVLQGKTILLHAEQGLGDTIQFCRYAKEVAALGARVVLEVQPALKSLLQDVEGASLVLGRGEQLPDFDYHCPLLSLPLAFQADLSNISGQKYLHSDPAKRQQWQTRLGPASKMRVGLVWSGATGHQNDHNRSLSLAQIAPLISDQAQHYCLQKEIRPADQATLGNTPALQFMGESLKDFSDTAALLEQMDLLITVDTSVAHLAGAMGKEVWVMLPFSPDWRWLLERSDNPWYDTARLFRQPAPGDWASVLAQVQAALKLRWSGVQRPPEPPSVPAPKPVTMTAQAQDDRLKQAVNLHQQGQLDQAQRLYKEILQTQPQHFDALQLLAMVEAQKNNPAAAQALFEQALAINPQHAGALNNYGNVLRALKRPEEALASYEQALMIKPDYAEALSNRGDVLWELKRPAEALESYGRVLAIQPGNVDALIGQGSALGELKRHVQSLESFDNALRIRPDSAQVLSNRGLALQNLKRYAEALENCDRALEIKPDYPEALSHRGNALLALQRPLEALESYDRALRINRAYAEALGNRGLALQDLNRLAEARDSYARALQLEPDRAETIWNESLCSLLMADFASGWPNYEWRWRREPGSLAVRNFPQALWLGKERLEGKTILLHAEQGLGDTIQFCRYAKQVAALGARVVLEVQPALKALLQGLEGTSVVIAKGEKLPDFDCHCPVLSLPLVFQANLSNISGAAYLQGDPAKGRQWRARLGESSKKRVGLVWSGTMANAALRKRAVPLAEMKTVMDGRASYYCLQKELQADDREELKRTPEIEFLGDSLKDFSDTAALLEQMDLLITVDTSVAHLAGAMGKEVWIMLPFSPDWRWLLNRSDNPWYDSVRLFRQSAPGNWASVLGEVQAALKLRLREMRKNSFDAPV